MTKDFVDVRLDKVNRDLQSAMIQSRGILTAANREEVDKLLRRRSRLNRAAIIASAILRT